MGNNLSYDEDSWLGLSDDSGAEMVVVENFNIQQHLNSAIGDVLNGILGNVNQGSVTMPVIRKKPDLSTFRNTSLYREIKALSGLPVNSRRPSERFCLMREMLKRENGVNNFTFNQQRRIANLYIPNEKEERLMTLDSIKLFICSFNKDGSKLITASNDSIIRIFDSSKGSYHRINRVKGKDVNWSILDVDSSPCGNFFAYSTWSDYFIVVPMTGSNEECQCYDLNTQQNRFGTFSIRFSPDGQKLLGGSNNSCIYMVDRETRRVQTVQTERNHQLDINAVSFVSDNDSNLFVSGCDNGVIKLWDMRCTRTSTRNNNNNNLPQISRMQPVANFLGHLDGITYIDPRNDGRYLLSNSKDQSIKLWDLRRTTPTNKMSGKHNLPLLDWDYRWDKVPRDYYNPTSPLSGDVSIMTYRGHRVTKSLLRAKFSPAVQTGQRFIYTGCATGRIIIYDVLTGTISEAIEGHQDIVRDLSWHPTRAEIVSSSWDSNVNLNVFKRNSLLKRPAPESKRRPVRRSRRIATQNGQLEEDDDDPDVSRW